MSLFDTNMVLKGPLLLNRDIKWKGQDQLPDILAAPVTKEEQLRCSRLTDATFRLVTMIRLSSIKTYMLTSKEMQVYVHQIGSSTDNMPDCYFAFPSCSFTPDASKSSGEFLNHVFATKSPWSEQTELALILQLEILPHQDKHADPSTPVPSVDCHDKNYALLYGRRNVETSCIEIYLHGLRSALSLSSNDSTAGGNRYLIERQLRCQILDAQDCPELKMIQSLRPSLFTAKKGDLGKRDYGEFVMSQLRALDKQRAETSEPARDLDVFNKRKRLLPKKKNPPRDDLLPIENILPPQKRIEAEPQMLAAPDKSASTADTTKENKTRLKAMIWAKLLDLGHDKRSEDTKLLLHQIYQSCQYILRQSFSSEKLDESVCTVLINKHLHFYKTLDDFINL
ncbi:uncharacterized protein BYT42DRAFT_564926 [Radiomyces spectabilis]|uniref:uncharacterized protein n=1 Tax=Radiomyces spectabilis TaxID=64574 RepID=UPI0022211112|nr:uncharacterized protein BYT42DRAFT_564926 [Radiomyces spectabilis]KAI8381010.1 hypothetical protein BYT42DRAFT_564926 [Radiomyces spectabilis]